MDQSTVGETACAHLKVEYRTSTLPKTGATIGWWQCASCPTLFITSPEIESLRLTNQRLVAENAEQKRKLMDWEEREAAVCPEDIGFDDYIRKALNVKIARLEAEVERMKKLSKDAFDHLTVAVILSGNRDTVDAEVGEALEILPTIFRELSSREQKGER